MEALIQNKLIILTSISLFFTCCWIITLTILNRAKKQNFLQTYRLKQHINNLEYQDETIQRLRQERTSLFSENTQLQTEIASLQTSLAEAHKQANTFHLLLESTQEQMTRNFQLMAEKIFTEKTKSFANDNKFGLESILKPVREQIADFKDRVEHVYDRDTKDRISLAKEIEHLKILNTQISEDAINLTNALKGGNKLQGFWGEMILEKLLLSSGLRSGHEYTVQKGFKDHKGKEMRPDVIISLPGERHIIIDSKTSMKAFEEACQTEEKKKQDLLLSRHLESIKKHVSELGKKKYHQLNGLTSPDFVLLFLPVESGFQAALALDPELTTWAGNKKIILTSPSTLLAILRLINHMWRQDDQSRNGLLIAKQAGSLYDKFIGFLDVFEEIGQRLDQSHNCWQTARMRLTSGKGNIISKAEALKKLGVQTEKTMPKSLIGIVDTTSTRLSVSHQDKPQHMNKIQNLKQSEKISVKVP